MLVSAFNSGMLINSLHTGNVKWAIAEGFMASTSGAAIYMLYRKRRRDITSLKEELKNVRSQQASADSDSIRPGIPA
jgi:hypothetical protein